MKLVFIYGQAAAGKLTVARELAALSGLPLFHNHLVVDAVGAVFPFDSEAFTTLRERFWLDVFAQAAAEGRSLIFTFAPEPTVAADFPARVTALVEAAGGQVIFVALTLPPEVQERRLTDPSRAAFGKLRSLDLLRELRGGFEASMAAMPAPAATIDTSVQTPVQAARTILSLISA
jgi:hypothetical protein